MATAWVASKLAVPLCKTDCYIVQCSGVVSANDTTDFTVKIDATGLQPDTRYYFAFSSGQQPVALMD